MSYIKLPERTSYDLNSAADINQLTENIDTVKNSVESDISNIETVILQHGYTGVRNTTLCGSVNASGYANFLAKDGANNNVKLSATSIPVRLAISDGFDAYGAREYIVSITSDVVPAAWSGLTTNGTYYLYVDYNTSTGAITYGITSVTPQDVYAKGAAGTNTLHNFVIPEMKMYVDDGSVWTKVCRRFVGEVVVSGSNITSVITYALMGKYTSALQTVPNIASFAGANIDANHNIGSGAIDVRAYYVCTGDDDGYVAGDRVLVLSFVTTNNAGTILSQPPIYHNRLGVGMVYRSDCYQIVSTHKSTGAWTATANGKWAVLFLANRNY